MTKTPFFHLILQEYFNIFISIYFEIMDLCRFFGNFYMKFAILFEKNRIFDESDLYFGNRIPRQKSCFLLRIKNFAFLIERWPFPTREWPSLCSFFYHMMFLTLLGKSVTSRMFSMPVTYITKRSKPRPKPPCGTVPNVRRSRYCLYALMSI